MLTLSDNMLRLSTFASFPKSCPIYSSRFSSAGFTYAGKSDTVRCTACDLEIGNWDGQKSPLEVHIQNSPSCPLVKKLGLEKDIFFSKPGLECSEDNCNYKSMSGDSGIVLLKNDSKNSPDFSMQIGEEGKNEYRTYSPESSETHVDGPNSRSCDSQPSGSVSSASWIPHTRPRYPQYCTMQERLNTFSKWPRHLPQTPKDLSRAGFYYSGVNDLVRCFQCGGGLTNWEAEDNPWVEHAHWFPECVFLRQNKGNEFIQIVQSMVEQLGNESENPQSNIADSLSASANNSNTAHGYCSETSDIEHLIAVRSVKEMGYGIDIIKLAYKEAVDKHKTSDISAVQVLEVVFEIEERKSTSNASTLSVPQMTETLTGKSENLTSTPKIQSPCIQYETTTGACKEAPDYFSNKDLLLCKVCMEEQVSIVFLPCGHLSTCSQCAPAMRKCPICREYVKGSVKTYLS